MVDNNNVIEHIETNEDIDENVDILEMEFVNSIEQDFHSEGFDIFQIMLKEKGKEIIDGKCSLEEALLADKSLEKYLNKDIGIEEIENNVDFKIETIKLQKVFDITDRIIMNEGIEEDNSYSIKDKEGNEININLNEYSVENLLSTTFSENENLDEITASNEANDKKENSIFKKVQNRVSSMANKITNKDRRVNKGKLDKVLKSMYLRANLRTFVRYGAVLMASLGALYVLTKRLRRWSVNYDKQRRILNQINTFNPDKVIKAFSNQELNSIVTSAKTILSNTEGLISGMVSGSVSTMQDIRNKFRANDLNTLGIILKESGNTKLIKKPMVSKPLSQHGYEQSDFEKYKKEHEKLKGMIDKISSQYEMAIYNMSPQTSEQAFIGLTNVPYNAYAISMTYIFSIISKFG